MTTVITIEKLKRDILSYCCNITHINFYLQNYKTDKETIDNLLQYPIYISWLDGIKLLVEEYGADINVSNGTYKPYILHMSFLRCFGYSKIEIKKRMKMYHYALDNGADFDLFLKDFSREVHNEKVKNLFIKETPLEYLLRVPPEIFDRKNNY